MSAITEPLNELLESAKSGTSRVGKTDLLKHLNGKKLIRSQAIRAKCYDCNGMGESDECDSVGCALYPYSPYRLKR
jgi:hypothetical protein